MGDAQRATILDAVDKVMRKAATSEVETGLCATFTARNAASAEVWIQVIAGNINMHYPFADDPVARFKAANAFGPRKAAELTDWQADNYVAWDTTGIGTLDVAFLVDRFFTAILGCDASYDPAVTIEDFDA